MEDFVFTRIEQNKLRARNIGGFKNPFAFNFHKETKFRISGKELKERIQYKIK